MFSNLNTPNQNQGFNNPNQTFNKSPFSFSAQKPQENNSIFQSPNSASFNNQPTTPLFTSKQSIFNNPQKSSLFSSQNQAIPLGAPTTTFSFNTNSQPQSNIFGSTFSSQPNAFGSTQTNAGMFGQSQKTNMFGQAATSAFGTNTSSFGQNQFGQNTNSNLGAGFGSLPSTNFGSQTSTGFGGTGFGTLGTASSSFGANSGSNFGSNFNTMTPASSSALNTSFGGTGFGSGGFGTSIGLGSQGGMQTSQTNQPFGQTPAFSSGFSASNSGANLFGSKTTSSGFLGSGTSSGFGATSNLGGPSAFGGTSTFGTSNFGGNTFGTTGLGLSNPTQASSGFGNFGTNPATSFGNQGFGSTNFGSGFGTSLNTNLTSSQPSIFSSVSSSAIPLPLPGFGTQSQPAFSSSFGSNLNTGLNNSFSFTGQNIKDILVQINSSDKNIDCFGYKACASRFGNPEYYNTGYSLIPDTNNFSEQGIEIASKTAAFEHESMSNMPFEYDLKLGNVSNINRDVEISPPSDTVSSLKFNRFAPEILACASWDSSIVVYKADENLNTSIGCRTCVTGLALDIDWINATNLIAACSNGILACYDIMTNNIIEFARHTGPVKAVRSLSEYNPNLVISGSYDGSVKIWDLRTKMSVNNLSCGKVIDLDVSKNNVAFINSDKEIMVYRLGEMTRPLFKKKVDTSPFPLRCVSITGFNCRKDGGWVCTVGTVGGKIGVFAQSNNAKDFTFKAYRGTHPTKLNAQIAFPIHHLEFHPKSFALAVAGGDGSVSFWDIQKHSHIQNLGTSSLPVTALSFHSSGRFMAYAVGYDWSRGMRGFKYKNMRPAIYVRRCNEELKYSPPHPVLNYPL